MVTADETKRADVYCEGRHDQGRGRRAGGAGRCRGRGCRRRAGDAGRDRPAHPHGTPLHGDRHHRRLLHRACGGARRRHHDDHRLRDPRSRDAAHGGLARLDAARRQGAVRLFVPRRDHQLEREDRGGHGRARARARGQQLQALHGLQGRDHARRREAAGELRALPGAGRALHRPCRERRAGLAPATAAAGPGHHRARGASAVAPARGGGRGGQPGDPHRTGAERADLRGPRLVQGGAGGRDPRPARGPAGHTANAWCSTS